MGTLRTPESQKVYNEVIRAGVMTDGCPLCLKESLKNFDLWRIIENQYPYDLIAKTHHMLVPKRHAARDEITPEEWKEFEHIKQSYLHDNYDFLIEASNKIKSIPTHWHLHLIIAKN
jgi:diadenosine tetraphosphate (Ap4A) HIT family hydrolase